MLQTPGQRARGGNHESNRGFENDVGQATQRGLCAVICRHLFWACPVFPWLAAGSASAALLFFTLWVGAEKELASEIEAANTRTVQAVAEASEMARLAERKAAEAEFVRLGRIAEAHNKARQSVAEALREAEAREPTVRTIIQEVNRGTTAEKCLDLPIPAAIRRSL